MLSTIIQWYNKKSIHFWSSSKMRDLLLKFYRLSDATFYDRINTEYQFYKSFLEEQKCLFFKERETFKTTCKNYCRWHPHFFFYFREKQISEGWLLLLWLALEALIMFRLESRSFQKVPNKHCYAVPTDLTSTKIAYLPCLYKTILKLRKDKLWHMGLFLLNWHLV